MNEFIKLNYKHIKLYNEYIDRYFYENLYLALDFSKNFSNDKYEKKSGDFYGYIENGELLGVFVFSNNNILHLSFVDDGVLKKVDLLRSIKFYKPVIIKGKKDNLEKIAKLFEKSISKMKINDYYIMKYNNNNIMKENYSTDIINNDCINNSFEFLVDVEKAFDRNPKPLNDIRTKILKKNKLNEYFAYTNENRIIAQGMLENKGKNDIVIGGIYTDEKYRKQGYASKIVKKLVKEVINVDKFPILLVKKNNENAIDLYRKIGFATISDFRILELTII